MFKKKLLEYSLIGFISFILIVPYFCFFKWNMHELSYYIHFIGTVILSLLVVFFAKHHIKDSSINKVLKEKI
jgi:hypothetical protein